MTTTPTLVCQILRKLWYNENIAIAVSLTLTLFVNVSLSFLRSNRDVFASPMTGPAFYGRETRALSLYRPF